MKPRSHTAAAKRSLAMIGVGAALVAALAGLAAPALAFESPNTPSSGGLVEEPKAWDGKAVTFEGEAIGEAMRRGENAWLHLNDDAYMYKNVEEGAKLDGYNSGMPVWLPLELAERVGVFGDYKHEGDVVRVTGTFNAACSEHGGDMDIHAGGLEVLIPGRAAADPVQPWKLLLALGMTATAAGVAFVDRRLGHRERVGMSRVRR